MTVAEMKALEALVDLDGKVPRVEHRDLFVMNARQMFLQRTMFLHREYDRLEDAMLKAREM